MFGLSIRDAATAMRARISGCPVDDPILGRPFPEISIDSRTLHSGEGFFALLGERLDGHRFLAQAVQAGASALVVQREPLEPLPTGLPILVVEDTTRALQDLARRLREVWGGRLIAITGSMGKTTTRDFTTRLLSQRLGVLQSRGNFNNHIGLPLSLSRLQRTHDVAVVELGMNHAGEIDRLGRICRPDLALITNIAPVHLEHFGSLEAIARAKGEILRSLPPEGCFVFNGDDPKARSLAGSFPGPVVSFGFEPGVDYRVSEWAIEDLSGMHFRLEGPNLSLSGRLGVLGKHFLYNAVAAVAVAARLALDPDEISRGLAVLTALEGRGQLQSMGPVRLWDDSYNSNPRALESVLETIALLRAPARKVLVLGDMLELGPEAPELHRQVGRRAAGVADLLITVGRLAEQLRAGAVESGFPAERTRHFASAEEAAEALPALLCEGDLVLIKASRGIHLDLVVDAMAGGVR
ncbi:MAG: UDP-N-acetylmuramoyl-tripeptide--D-alanyl-D-alanine ligase [Acidobacteriota bacterium]